MADVTKRISTIGYISIDQMQRYHYRIPSFLICRLRFIAYFIQAHIAIHFYSLVDRNTLKQLPDVNEDKVDKSK